MSGQFARVMPVPSREPLTVKVAVWSARHRYPVFAAWLVLIAGLMFGSIALGGQRSQSVMDKGQTIGDSQTGRNAFSDADANVPSKVQTETFYLIVSNPAGPLDTTENWAAIAAMTRTLSALTATHNGATVPAFYQDPAGRMPAVVDPYALAAIAPDQAPGVLSADGTTAIITARISGDNNEATAKAEAIGPVAAEFRAQYPNLTIYAFNNRLMNDDFGEYVNNSLDGLLLPTMIITLIILLIACRSLVAALVPIVLAVSAITGAMGLVGIYSRTVAPVSQYVGQIVVMIGLAVAVDYSLFVVSRFRTERGRGNVSVFGMVSGALRGGWSGMRASLREQDGPRGIAHGRTKFDAIEVASSTAGRAVFFSGMAVMISLCGLLLINDDVFKSLAIGSISVVLISVIGSLTFLPATLAILDRWVLRFGLPVISRDRGEGHGIWGTIVRAASRRPVIAVAAAGAVLIAVALPVSKLQLGSTTSDVTTLPHSLECVRAWELISQKWPQGRQLTVEVIVTDANKPATAAAIQNYVTAVKQGNVPGVNAGNVSVSVAGDGTVASIITPIPGSPNDLVNWDLAREFRTTVVPGILRLAVRHQGVRLRRRRSHYGSGRLVRRPDAPGDGVRAGDELHAAARGFPLDHHRVEGHHPEPALGRRRLRCPGPALPGRLVQGIHRHQAQRDRGLGSGHDLHDPVRALDGLPRLHPDPGQGSARSRPRFHGRRGQGHHDHRRHGHERGRDHGLSSSAPSSRSS